MQSRDDKADTVKSSSINQVLDYSYQATLEPFQAHDRIENESLKDLIDYAWQLYRWSSESYSGIVSISTEVGSLHIALKVTEELLTEETLSAELQTKIVGVKDDCYKTLRELQSFLARYVNQSTQSQRAWDMMDWVREEVLG